MDNLRDPGERQKIEYATQFFGFPPDSMIDALMGDATDTIKASFQAAKSHSLKQFGERVSEKEVNEAFVTLEERCIESTEDIYYKKFGRYVRENIFNIPKHVVLPEDKVHCEAGKENLDSNDFEVAKTRFEALCSNIKDHKFMKVALEHKLSRFRAILERQERLLAQATVLKENVKVLEVFDAQKDVLDKKRSALQPLMVKMENNMQNDSGCFEGSDPAQLEKKRQFDLEDTRLAKKCKLDDD
ncbi:hypothetical protein TCAL_15143, partial [Tigriopus californicus]